MLVERMLVSMPIHKPVIKVFSDKEQLIACCADYLGKVMKKILHKQGLCTVTLAGGSTPRGLYQALASPPWAKRIAWERVHLFWGDERTVPSNHQDSNYRMVREALIDNVPLPETNVHPIIFDPPQSFEPAEAALAARAAERYEDLLARFFYPPRPAGETPGKIPGKTREEICRGKSRELAIEPPKFDIILLGIGDDGHTASLFPGTPAVQEKKRWVTEVYVPRLNSWRVTLTLPVINNAALVVFLVSGSSKAGAVSRVVKALFPDSDRQPQDRHHHEPHASLNPHALNSAALNNKLHTYSETVPPAARVLPCSGRLLFFMDREAAAGDRHGTGS